MGGVLPERWDRGLILGHRILQRRQAQLDHQSARIQVACLDPAAVNSNCARGDGEPEPIAAHCPVTGGINTVERFEYQLQVLLGYARAAVPYHDLDLRARALRSDSHL